MRNVGCDLHGHDRFRVGLGLSAKGAESRASQLQKSAARVLMLAIERLDNLCWYFHVFSNNSVVQLCASMTSMITSSSDTCYTIHLTILLLLLLMLYIIT